MWENESGFRFNRTSDFFDFVEEGKTQDIINLLPESLRDYRHVILRKVQNLMKTSARLFGPERVPFSPMSTDFIILVHQEVVEGLDISSEFRKNMAKPAGSALLYAAPDMIHSRLTILVEFLNLTLTPSLPLEQAILLATLCFSEFLLIHPFSNGNGRTARILIGWILREYTIVPISIISNRHDYLAALEARVENPPLILSNLIATAAACTAFKTFDLFS